MIKQYCFEVRRGHQAPFKMYHICADDVQALAWIGNQARTRDWGEHGFNWTVCVSSRPITEVYEHDGDRTGYLCELAEELFAREISNNCPNTEFRGLSWNELCQAIIEIAEVLKGDDKNA